MTSGVKRKESPSCLIADTADQKRQCLHANYDEPNTQMETDQVDTQCQKMTDEKFFNAALNENANNNSCLNNNNYLPQHQQCTRCLAGEPGHFNHLS